MHLVTFASARFLLADEVSDALLELVVAMGRGRDVDLVSLPAAREDGGPCRVQLTVHGRSEIVSMSIDTAVATAADADARAVADLRERIAGHERTLVRPIVEDARTAAGAFGL